jgi:hypothetical protein
MIIENIIIFISALIEDEETLAAIKYQSYYLFSM